MPHTTNRDAFRRCDTAEPFFRLYTLLVALELALKDHSASFADRHDLDAIIKRTLASNTASNLQAALTTFEQSLAKLRCTLRSGSGATVSPRDYPGLRYVRLSKDGFRDGSQDAEILQALTDAQSLIREIERAGVQV